MPYTGISTFIAKTTTYGGKSGTAVISADTTVAALTEAATAVVGNTVAVNTHLYMRFNTGAITAADQVFNSYLYLASTAVAGTPLDMVLWASEFPLGVIKTNLPKKNHATPVRVPIATMFASAASATEVAVLAVPERFVNKTGENAGFSDFELRPSAVATTSTNTRTFGGATAASGAAVTGGAIISTVDGLTDGAAPTITASGPPTLYVYYYNPALTGTATGGSVNTLIDSGLAIGVDEYIGATVKITSGPGVGQTAVVRSNTATTFTLDTDLDIAVSSGATYLVELDIPVPCVSATGSESYVAFDIEDTCGAPVKGKYLMDIESSDLDSEAENLVSRALRQERSAPAKMAVGRAGGGGTVAMEATPEKCWKLLRGFFKRRNTVDVDGHSNDGVADLLTGNATDNTDPATAPYTHTFTVAKSDEISFFTFVQKESPFSRSVYPGGVLDTLNLTASLDSLVNLSARVMARDVYTYSQTAAGGPEDPYLLSASAGYDSNDPLSFVGGEISFNGSVDRNCVQNISINISNNSGERRCIRRNRGVKGHYVGKFTVGVNFSMYFENHDLLRKFLGVNHTDFPYAAERSLSFDNVDIKFAGSLGEDSQELVLRLPKINYTVVRRAIQGDGPIYLEATGIATVDTANFGSMVVFLKNDEPLTAFNASTDLINILPTGKRY